MPGLLTPVGRADTLATMTDLLPIQSALQAASSQAVGAALRSTGEPSDASFQQTLNLLLMSGLSSGEQAGGGAVNLLMVMAVMLERMIQQQTTSPTPEGEPVTGRVTQGPRVGHMAIDYGVPVGTPVRATMDGRVVRAGWDASGYGNLVVVENGGYQTFYAHLSGIPVAVGQMIRADEVIGYSGNTGNSTGPHLHYEIRIGGQAVDPTSTLNPVASGPILGEGLWG